jgi:epoxyqueuosine reductase
LVRADQVAAGVPRAVSRKTVRPDAVANLRQSRFLTPDALKTALAQAARTHGFDAIGIARPEAISQAAERLRAFLAAGAHGDMAWLATNAERRSSPRAMWPDVRSIIMLGVNYGPQQGPDADPLAILQQRTRGGISVYARGDG